MKAKTKVNVNKALSGTSININVVGVRYFKFKIMLVKFLAWVIAKLLKPQKLHVNIDR